MNVEMQENQNTRNGNVIEQNDTPRTIRKSIELMNLEKNKKLMRNLKINTESMVTHRGP